MPTQTQNLGLVTSIIQSMTAPSNTAVIWFDTNPGVLRQKFFNTSTSQWELIGGGATPTYTTGVIPVATSTSTLGDGYLRQSANGVINSKSYLSPSEYASLDLDDTFASMNFDDGVGSGYFTLDNTQATINHSVKLILDAPQYNFAQLTASTVPYINSSNNLVSSSVTPTQLGYLDATSSIQTQLNSKQSQLNGTGFIKANGTSISYDNSVYLTATTGWAVNGNTLGNDTSWIGSSDNYDFLLKTNNTTRVTFAKDGTIGIGGAPSSDRTLAVAAGSGLITVASFINNTVAASGGIGYGVSAVSSGANTTNYGGYFSATNATHNYAIYAIAGDAYINAGRIGVNIAPDNTATVQITSSSTDIQALRAININSGSENYGVSGRAQGAGTTNYGGIFSAQNASNNYAIVVPAGMGSVGIGTVSPAYLLHIVGTGTTSATYTAVFENNANTKILMVRDDGYVKFRAINGAISDGDLSASQFSAYIDETGNLIIFKVKYADGTTVKTGSVALV